MARKAKKKVVEEQPPADDDGNVTTEEESVHDDDDVQMKDSDDKDEEEETKKSKKTTGDKKSKKNKAKTSEPKEEEEETTTTMIPFMDTFYQLSSEDSPKDRSLAARDLIHHCFLVTNQEQQQEEGSISVGVVVNHQDAAYALTRLMNGLCTGRAASRQGFASCLTSFLRVAYSSSLNDGGGDGSSGAMDEILKEDDYAKKLKDTDASAHPTMIVRQKLLSTTQFLEVEGEKSNNNGKQGGQKKNHRFGSGGGGGKMKGIEERDHAFGRLFGILAVVRSGILGLEGCPSVVVEGFTKDLIELFHYKKWMREPSAHALIELLSSLDSESNKDLIAKVANDVITPTFFLFKGSNKPATDLADRAQWLQTLTPEQIAVALHLQMPRNDEDIKFEYPLDEPLVTAESVPTLSAALASTSSVVHPRCHVVWNTLWMYLTEEKDKSQEGSHHRQLRTNNEEFPSIIEKIIQHVVVDILLGKGEDISRPTNERRSLALQIVCSLSGSSSSSDLKIALPPNLIGSVLCPEVIVRVFANVLCASGGGPKKKKATEGGSSSSVEHHLKPLTSQALADLIDCYCEDDDVGRRMALAKAFLLTDPRFDNKTKTRTISSLLMLENSSSSSGSETSSEKSEKKREALWQQYRSFLEEEIVSATSLHSATVYIELMYKLAKCDLTNAPANEAKRIVRFFMSGAFFDCSDLSDPSVVTNKKSKKKKGKAKTVAAAAGPPQELSSGLRIQEILKANGMSSISHPARAIMSARFYSLLSDFISVINSQNRGGNKNKAFYGTGSRPESIFQALSEICGICSLLETSGAKQFPVQSASLDSDDDASDAEDPIEASKKLMLQVQSIANDALVKECGGSGDEDILRAKAVFTTGCSSLMTSLYLQLNSCGKPDVNGDDEEEEEEDDDVEAVVEYISDLADCVDGFCKAIEDGSSYKADDDEENPLAAMAGLLVNILSSPVGGEDFDKSNPIQASASKLTRETVKLAWSGIISVITGLSSKNTSLKSLVDEDVMNILIESVCGEKSMGDEEEEDDDESIEGSVSSEDGLGDSAVFVDASESGMDLDEIKETSSVDSKESDDDDKKDDTDEDGDDDVELDRAKLDNLLLEDADSDAEMILEHHAGADKALAQLIKLKQEARKASQTERERVDLCNRLRCAGLLDSLFSVSVFKSGWLPIEAVLGSIAPILRSRKAIAKSIQMSTSANAKKSLSEKNALLDRLSALVKDKISKFRCNDNSEAAELALKASSDIYEEMKHSLNVAHCSCCSVALITAMRCISNIEENDVVKGIYVGAVDDWSSRKATKIHVCVFDDLVQRMPSLASLILVDPLVTAAKGAHSSFLKCESIKLLSAIYKHDSSNAEEQLTKKARNVMKESCIKVAVTLTDALGDSNLQKAKHRDEVLNATKHFINYVKSQNEAILTDSELCAMQDILKTVGGNCKSAGMKKLCSQVSDTISGLARRVDDEEPKSKRPKAPKTPKSSKKQKKSKK